MTARHGLGTYGNAVGTVTPLDHKLDQAGIVIGDTTSGVRAGVFWNGGTSIVSGAANMSYNIAAFKAVLTRGATAGAVLIANDATVNIATTAAPGANSRYDVVYLWQREFSLDGTDSEPVLGVVQGTPSASPTIPSLAAFPGALSLATILVPTGTTATNTGTTITQVFPFTSTNGGHVAFRTVSDLTAWTTAPLYTKAFVFADATPANNMEYNRTASGWILFSSGMVPLTPTSVTATGGSFSTSGNTVKFTGVTGGLNVNGVFASGYARHLIKLTFDAVTSSNIILRLRLAGTDDASANYQRQVHTALGTGATASATLSDVNWYLFGQTIGNGVVDVNLSNASRAKSTNVQTQSYATLSTTQLFTTTGGSHQLSTAYDGFSIATSTAVAMTGDLQIFGFPGGDQF